MKYSDNKRYQVIWKCQFFPKFQWNTCVDKTLESSILVYALKKKKTRESIKITLQTCSQHHSVLLSFQSFVIVFIFSDFFGYGRLS